MSYLIFSTTHHSSLLFIVSLLSLLLVSFLLPPLISPNSFMICVPLYCASTSSPSLPTALLLPFSYLFSHLLYSFNTSGMRPVCYSCKDAAEKGIGWLRTGSAITYTEGLLGKENSINYSLSFTIDFQHSKDTVLIAYSYPYTMSDYQTHMKTILNHPRASDVIRSSPLCTTLGGERCDLLVITDFKVPTPPRPTPYYPT